VKKALRNYITYSAVLCMLLFVCCQANKKADMVIFSYDRPLQLYALLESMHAYSDGLQAVNVVFRVSSDRFLQAYQRVQTDFPGVDFLLQESSNDFKPLTLKATFESPNEHVIFAVDDIIVKDFIDLSECIDLLEKYNAWGFYLRLGRNLSRSYACNRKQPLPPLVELESGVLKWHFSQGRCDWRYPHTVDMTLYKKSDIRTALQGINYKNPNEFESIWAAKRPGRSFGLCFEHSKIVNVPLNRIQTVFCNRCMDSLSTQELLAFFEQGKKIDIKALFAVTNKSAHMDYRPIFVER